jgi:hypothetical protein
MASLSAVVLEYYGGGTGRVARHANGITPVKSSSRQLASNRMADRNVTARNGGCTFQAP